MSEIEDIKTAAERCCCYECKEKLFLLSHISLLEQKNKELKEKVRVFQDKNQLLERRYDLELGRCNKAENKVFYTTLELTESASKVKELERQLNSCTQIREAEKLILIEQVEKNTKLKEAIDTHRNTPNSTHAVFGIDGEKQEVLILAKIEADQKLYRAREGK